MSWRDLTQLALGISTRTFSSARVVFRPDRQALEITAVYDAPHVSIDPDTGGKVSSTSTTLGVRLSDFDEPPIAGHMFDVDGVRFRVHDVEPDGQGGASLILKRVSP